MGVIPKAITEVVRKAFSKPFTVNYPFEKVEIPPGYRGRISWSVKKCIGCSICARVCPAEAIVMVKDERTKTKKAPRFIHYRCIFCALCQEHCPTKAIQLTNDYSLYAFNKEDIKIIETE